MCPDWCKLSKTLGAVPSFRVLDPALGVIQVQGHGPSLWNPVPKGPYGGMPTMTGKAWTLYNVQHCKRVRQGHPASMTITVKMGLCLKYIHFTVQTF